MTFPTTIVGRTCPSARRGLEGLATAGGPTRSEQGHHRLAPCGSGSAWPDDRSGCSSDLSCRSEDDWVVDRNRCVAAAACRPRDDPVFQSVGRGMLAQDRQVAGGRPVPKHRISQPGPAVER